MLKELSLELKSIQKGGFDDNTLISSNDYRAINEDSLCELILEEAEGIKLTLLSSY